MNRKWLVVLVVCLIGVLNAEESRFSEAFVNFLNSHPEVNQEIAEEMYSCMLPEDHPIKGKLDRLFATPVQSKEGIISRPTCTPEHFKAAGFTRSKPNQFTKLLTSPHPELKGYFIKAYADSIPGLDEWWLFLKRIRGANQIRQCIERYGLTLFQVPKKWLYLLPPEPLPPLDPKFMRRSFVLVAERMEVMGGSGSYFAWKTKVTPQMLDQFYFIVMELGLGDSLHPDNSMITKDGKIVFVDTEGFGDPNMFQHLPILTRHLSPQMQDYWKQLIANGGPTTLILENSH